MTRTDETTDAERTDDESAPDRPAPEPGESDLDESKLTEAVGEQSLPEAVTGDVLLVTHPLVRPVLAQMATVALVAIVLIGVLLNDPGLVGGRDLAEILVYTITVLGLVILLRLAVKVIVLRRTEYTIADDGFEMAYSLLYRQRKREVPVEHLRAHELDRGRYQAVWGCASIELLTGGTDRSLGFVEFENVLNPEEIYEMIQRIRRAHDREA